MLNTIPCPDCDGRGFITEFTECSVSGKRCSACDGLGYVEVLQTNEDRVRAMSDEELAVFVRAVIMAEDCPVTGCDCDKCFFKEVGFNGSKWYGKETEWLKQPAEGE